MASCSSDEKCTLTERFEQQAMIKFCVNSGMTPIETWKFFGSNDSVKSVPGQLCLRLAQVIPGW